MSIEDMIDIVSCVSDCNETPDEPPPVKPTKRHGKSIPSGTRLKPEAIVNKKHSYDLKCKWNIVLEIPRRRV